MQNILNIYKTYSLKQTDIDLAINNVNQNV